MTPGRAASTDCGNGAGDGGCASLIHPTVSVDPVGWIRRAVRGRGLGMTVGRAASTSRGDGAGDGGCAALIHPTVPVDPVGWIRRAARGPRTGDDAGARRIHRLREWCGGWWMRFAYPPYGFRRSCRVDKARRTGPRVGDDGGARRIHQPRGWCGGWWMRCAYPPYNRGRSWGVWSGKKNRDQGGDAPLDPPAPHRGCRCRLRYLSRGKEVKG